MAEVYYVASDTDGFVREGEQQWQLDLDGDNARVEAADPPLPVHDPDALLERLDEVVWLAVPAGSSYVLSRTAWDYAVAARFALDCAEHAIGTSADVALPSGSTLGEVLREARRYIDRSASESDEKRLGRLSRLATARRLRRSGGEIGDLARAIVAEDTEHELEASSDPAWLVAVSISDAVLAVVEALRHVALPRYVKAREEVAAAHDGEAGDAMDPIFLTSPWGDFVIGAEHDSPYAPASHLAREAAFHARESIRERSGETAADDERSWQAERLAALLTPAG